MEGSKPERVKAVVRRPREFDYNVVVIGAGSAGLVASYVAATLKAKVALIEAEKMGGDCLNTGCVPSKALIRSARWVSDLKRAREFGFPEVEVRVDFASVMERVQRVIREIEPHDSVERYTELGVECVSGRARVVTPNEVEVGGRRLTTRSIIVATGAGPRVPAIPGLDQVTYLTTDTVWNLRERPRRLIVLGGGPIGIELGQAFARLGSEVTVVEKGSRILAKEDADVAEFVSRKLRDEGVRILADHEAARFEPGVLLCRHLGREVRVEFDQVLIALGREARVKGFGLEELGVELTSGGTIEADDFLMTNVPGIYVCGDAVGPYQFTHMASHQAGFAALNALFSGLKRFRVDCSVVPWTTFTEPEVARVGLSEAEAIARGVPYEVTRYGIDDLDRAIAENAAEGFVKVLTVPGKDRILGAVIVGERAGELLGEFVLAMKNDLGLKKIFDSIHVYPTFLEANRFAAGAWRRAHAPQGALRWLERFHAWRRG